MIRIRPDEVERIAIDRFVSTSGLWLCLLCECFEPGNDQLKSWHIVILTADTHKVRKIVLIARDNPILAFDRWENWKEKFSAKVDYLAEADGPSGLSELKFSMPYITDQDRIAFDGVCECGHRCDHHGTDKSWCMICECSKYEEDKSMLKMNPMGARCFVREIVPIDEVSTRAAAVNLTIVLAEENKPKPTMGVVVKVGDDPFIQEKCKPGDILMFSKHAGSTFMEAGQEYRYIDIHEIIGVRYEKDGIDDLLPVGGNHDSHVGAVGGE